MRFPRSTAPVSALVLRLGIALVAPTAAAGTLSGYQTALWISVALAAVALVASLLVKAPSDIEGERV
ncbi:hypothetical protein [Rhodococcus marinonascens]|uniref:hypothetical protein n=1 Tax=Rhodococcus marinonascens TaxID=38311 RepID=UPI000A039F03|nr:hypothetical protein [Rhodococcus marinonascens]